MRTLAILAMILELLVLASVASAQNIGLSFDEEGTQFCLDGHTELVPNPDLGDFPSARVFVGAWDLSELFGYEYRIESTDATAITGTPIFYPSTSANFGTNGDVRVGTGVCFHQGDAEAGPDPDHIRLAQHVYTWFAPPTLDVFYCIGPISTGGYTAPNYTECVDTPVPLPFGVYNTWGCSGWDCRIPEGCIAVLFDLSGEGVTQAECDQALPAQSQSWGSLKAAY